MAVPYSVPYCTVKFEPTYQIIDKLGYSQHIPMPDVWADVLTDLKAAEAQNKDVGIATVQTATATDAQLPQELVLSSSSAVQLLWLERTLGCVCLRPIPFISSSCTLLKEVTWRIGHAASESAVGAGDTTKTHGSQSTAGTSPYLPHPVPDTTQNSQIKNNWYPLAGAEYENVWREVKLPGARSDASNAKTATRLAIDGDFLKQNPVEHYLASSFTLEKNASFAFTFTPRVPIPGAKGQNNKLSSAYFRVYWGKKHCIQYDGVSLKYSYNAGISGISENTEFVDVTGLNLKPNPNGFYKGMITIVVQILGNAVVISNLEDTPPSDVKTAKHGWAYRFKDKDSMKNGLTVEADLIYCGINGINVEFAYIPIYYTPSGILTSRPVDTGVSLQGIKASYEGFPSTPNSPGGTITLTATPSDTTFNFTATLARDANVINRTPQLFTINIKSSPTTKSIPINVVDISNRVRTLTLTHGIFDKNGTLVVDNRDGLLKNSVGVFPLTIETGWIRANGTKEFKTRFKGFSTNISIDKKAAPYSTATLTLVGRSLQLKDAIAVNLPIYDGEIHTDAVTDLVQRGGWAQETNYQPNGRPYFTDPFYRLSIPAKPGDQPMYMFSLGTSIWSCIEEIGRPTGYWAYIDSLGVFNYVPPFEGDEKMTYSEVPETQFEYTEWQSLSMLKDMSDVKSAVIVVGLDASFDNPKYLTAVNRATGGVGFGDPTVGSNTNFIPWLRWIVIQDGKLNDQAIVDWVCRRVFDNNNRPRWTINGQVWGNPTIFPLDTIKIKLGNGTLGKSLDQMGLPAGGAGKWRVLTVNETLNADDKSYFMQLECEWIDPRYSYAAWWGRN